MNNLPLKYFELLKEDHLSLLYHGSFLDDIVPKIIALSEHDLKESKEPIVLKNRVSFLIAECFQNVLRHAENFNLNKENQINTNFFTLRNQLDKYYISSANLLNNNKVAGLKTHLERINHLDNNQLKELHQQVLKYGGISEKGGAGLGLITIAQKSGHSIDYFFEQFSEEFSIFYNQIILPLVRNVNLGDEPSIRFTETKEFYNSVISDKVLLVQKGNFEHKFVLSLLNILETNINSLSERKNKNQIIYHIAVEMLQNISEHAMEIDNLKEGILIIAFEKNKYKIITGNFIETKKAIEFVEWLKQLSVLSKDELKDLYLSNLKKDTGLNKTSANVGIIDIARYSEFGIEYQLESINDYQSFISLAVTV